MTGVIDYGVGNLFSLISSLKAIGAEVVLSSDKNELKKCDRLVLPGVGAFGAAMDKLSASGLTEFVRDYGKNGGKLLGICLGMQLLFERSFEFGEHKGLGLIGGDVVSLKADLTARGFDYKVPQMGWNALTFDKEHTLTKNVSEGEHVYYVHSFYAPKGEYTVAHSEYGVDVTGIAACGSVAGCQFHPEKSGDVGLNILRAFALGD